MFSPDRVMLAASFLEGLRGLDSFVVVSVYSTLVLKVHCTSVGESLSVLAGASLLIESVGPRVQNVGGTVMDLTMDQVRGICSTRKRESCGEELLYQSQIDFRVPTACEFRSFGGGEKFEPACIW